MKGRFVLVSTLLLLISCNRDPNVAKKKYLEMGDRYFQREQYRQAALLYRNAIQRDARYGMAHYKLALTELKLSNPGAALKDLRRAVETLPANASTERTDANIKLADLYLVFGARDKQLMGEVDTVAQDLVKKDPNSFDGHRILAALAFVNARQNYSTGQTEAGKTSLKTAIAEFRKADAAKPGQTPIKMSLAEALVADRDFPEAEKMCRELIAKDKTLSQPYLQLYQIFIAQN